MSNVTGNVPLERYRALLVAYLKPQSSRVTALGLVLLSGIALQLLNPQVLRFFIDSAVGKADPSLLARAALLFTAVALLRQILSAYGCYLSEDISWTTTNRLRGDLLYHCLRLDLSFHKARTPGEMIERIDGDVTALANFLSQFIVGILANLLFLAGLLALLWRIHWWLGLGLGVFGAVTLGVLWGMRYVAIPRYAAFRQAYAGFFGSLGEWLTGIEDVKANGAGPYVLRGFHQIIRKVYRAHRRAGFVRFSMMGAGILLFAAGTAAALAAGAYLYMKGLMSIGTAYLVFAYTELMRAPLEQIRTQIQDLQRAGASIARIESLLGIRSRTRESDACRRLAAGALAVEFDKVSFAYEDEQQMVLREVSFSLTPGRVLGILGRTGSGKTTIARLLFRLYDPSSGEIRLDGIPAWEAGLTDLRQRIGMVTQDVELFHASVRDNLTFFRRSIPDERILAVLLEVGLGGWYASLPAGLDTVIGSNGGGLSAGEAQLLAFARLFLTEPGLVVMDEASSRLDPVTESLLERAVDRALHGRTGIIIAHRLGTIQRVDDVLILEDGRVLEYGEREQLAQNPSSHFYRLLKTGLEEVLA